MPQPRVHELPPIDLGEEAIHERIARLRKERGLTQQQLADDIGLTQSLISSYESGRRGLSAELVARFALALEISTDELIGLKTRRKNKSQVNGNDFGLPLIRRMKKIQSLPAARQKAVLQSIDLILGGATQTAGK